MAFATTNQTGLYFVAESAWGTTPTTPSLQELRYTGEGINYEIENVTSDEIRSDRMTSDTVQVGQSTSGNLDFELSYGSYDEFFESSLYQSFVPSNSAASVATVQATATINEDFNFDNGGSTITIGSALAHAVVEGQLIEVTNATDTDNNAVYKVTSVSGQALTVSPAPATTNANDDAATITGSGDYIIAGTTANYDISTNTAGTVTFGSSLTHAIVVGQWVQLGGFVASNLNGVYHRVTAVSGNVLTVSPAPLTTEANNATGAWVSSARLRNAPTAATITQKPFTLQKRFNDATSVVYQNLTGMVSEGMSMSFDTGSILTGSFNFIGKASTIGTSQIAGASDLAATTTDVMNAVSNLQNIEFDDTDTTACLVSMTLDTTGNLRAQNCVGSLPAVGIGTGRQEITGSITLFFEDITEYNKFLNNTAFKISFRVQDSAGNAYAITLPKVKYEGMTMNSGGLDGEVELSGTYRALLGTTGGVNYMMEIDRLPATVA